VERELYFQSFARLHWAFDLFLQALFIARRTYPIADNKWIREQVVEILGLPELYEKLPGLFEIQRFESAELAEKADELRQLLKYLRAGFCPLIQPSQSPCGGSDFSRGHLSHPMVGDRRRQIADLADEEVADRTDGQRPSIDEPGFRGQTPIPRKTVHADPCHRGDNPLRAYLAHPVVPVIQDEEVPEGIYCQADGTVQPGVRGGTVVPREATFFGGAG
jgi:hypothetical protein